MRVLAFSSRGPAVQLLQLALNRSGFASLETDGVFGPATQAALTRFQAAQGLKADGVAGPLSHRALLPWYTGFLRHRLRPGESFWSLAQLYGSELDAILTANPGLDPEALPVGTLVVVPLPFPVVPTSIDYCSELVAYCVRGLAARYPFLRVDSIGRSVLGRPLWSLSLGSGENRVLYTAEHHANEWITTPLLLRFTEELAAAYATGGELFGRSAAQLLDYAALCLIPAVNPDGMDLVTGELRSGESWQRARQIAADYPRYPFPSGWKANIRGTDLNLQYPAGWEEAKKIKYAQGVRGPAPMDYVGPMPLSAPESRAMYDYTLALSPRLTLSYHTQGGEIYWRYGECEPEGAQKQVQHAVIRVVDLDPQLADDHRGDQHRHEVDGQEHALAAGLFAQLQGQPQREGQLYAGGQQGQQHGVF